MPTINKVIVDGEEIINLDNDTLSSASQLLSGVTAHSNTGEIIVGTAELAEYDYALGGSLVDRTLTGYHISETATKIRDNMFEYQGDLQSINIPNSVVSIGDSAFMQCISLTNLDCSNVSTVYSSAFISLNNILSLLLKNGVEVIPIRSGTVKLMTLNDKLYWCGGASDGCTIYESEIATGEPSYYSIGSLTAENPTFTYSGITFTRTGTNNNFTITW